MISNFNRLKVSKEFAGLLLQLPNVGDVREWECRNEKVSYITTLRCKINKQNYSTRTTSNQFQMIQ